MEKQIPAIEIDWAAIGTALAPWIQRLPEFTERFGQIPKRHKQLQEAALSQIQTWEAYTFPSHKLNPSAYLLDNSKYNRPGRRLKIDPGPESKMVRYGVGANGRKLIMRWPNEVNIHEWIWEYHADRIDGTDVTVVRDEIWPNNVESLFLENGSPIFYIRFGSQGVFLNLFRYKDGRIVEVLKANGNMQSGTDPNKGWRYGWSDIFYDEKGDAHVRSFGQPYPYYPSCGYAHVYKMPKASKTRKKIPQLDLREDVADTVAALGKAVEKFSGQQKKSAEPVSGIGLGFFVYENPEIFFSFDTRLKFEPNGDWTHPEFARLKRARWDKFVEACEGAEGKGVVIDAQGNQHEIAEISSEKNLTEWIGNALVTALKTARDTGVFQSLKIATRCELGVEEAGNGEYGWPHYEDRGKENLI